MHVGAWGLAAIVIVVVSWLMYRYLAPASWKEWARAGVVQAFIIGFYAEMYGFPLTFQDVYPGATGEYCFRCSFNLTFPNEADPGAGWTSPYHFGINLGPVVLMCENYRSGLPWRLMRECPYVVTGLRCAGFTKGWL